MLDSLVRVSRRVGWGANQFATNLKHHLGRNPVLDDKQSDCTVNSPAQSNKPRRPSTQALEQVRLRSSALQPANTIPVCNTPPRAGATFQRGLRRPESRLWRSPRGKCTGQRLKTLPRKPVQSIGQPRSNHGQLNSTGRLCGPIRLPLNGFTYSLTLSSKYFSTFPHGTCMLSVSHRYLALDGVYHPLWAAFPNNPTPRTLQGTAAGILEA